MEAGAACHLVELLRVRVSDAATEADAAFLMHVASDTISPVGITASGAVGALATFLRVNGIEKSNMVAIVIKAIQKLAINAQNVSCFTDTDTASALDNLLYATGADRMKTSSVTALYNMAHHDSTISILSMNH